MITPQLIISGGQTGADMGGLRAAKFRNIATSGWAPRDWWTERGTNLELRDIYGLVEHFSTSHDYAPRTRANVEMADATVIFGKRSRGSNLTESLCKQLDKPWIWLQHPNSFLTGSQVPITKFRLWLSRVKPSTLNVAGNRESVNPGIEFAVMQFLSRNL